MAIYTFESSDEAFLFVNNASWESNWNYSLTGMDHIYIFELENMIEYDIVQSINAYSTMSISHNFVRDFHQREHVEARMLVQIDATDEIYNKNRFKGEIR